jgi:hypothetical protein
MSENKSSTPKKKVEIDPMSAKVVPTSEITLKPTSKSPRKSVQSASPDANRQTGTGSKRDEVKKPTVSQEIWSVIKNVKIPIFGLSNQLVSDHCEPIELDPSKCYLKIKASSVIPLLEETFKDQFNFEAAFKYLIVSKKV